MKYVWNTEHGKILMTFLHRLETAHIRYFVLRGYEGLPDRNYSKDVDIMIETGREKTAEKYLLEAFREAGLAYYYPTVFGHAHCFLAMSVEKKFSIHIDLIDGYVSKGYEVITFDEMYRHTIEYNGIKILDPLMNGIMLLVYKLFGYHRAKLKPAYKKEISEGYRKNPEQFTLLLKNLAGKNLGEELAAAVAEGNYERIVSLEPEFTRALARYTWRRRRLGTVKYRLEFFWQKFYRIVLVYRKYAKVIAVLAPDGTGKTTFLEALAEQINFYFVNDPEDERTDIYHFRPGILPNLGEIGEKAGVMKQDTNFTEPHRGKPAGRISSLCRCAYYTMDYIIGWQTCVRHDVHYDKITVFDRYSYDMLVDPLRTKLNLSEKIRAFFVSLTPAPSIVFVLTASAETIYRRKQELTKEEISRQIGKYQRLADSGKPFKTINAEKRPEQMAEEAMKLFLDRFANPLEEI